MAKSYAGTRRRCGVGSSRKFTVITSMNLPALDEGMLVGKFAITPNRGNSLSYGKSLLTVIL